MDLDRDYIINDYYEKIFDTLCYTGAQKRGSAYFHRIIEKYYNNSKDHMLDILEVGAGSGEHLPYLNSSTLYNLNSYTLLDLREQSLAFSNVTPKININNKYGSKKHFFYIQGSVEKIPFKSGKFDRVTSTCLFHHLDNPLKGFQEIRRVLRVGGQASIGLPTDPGLLNRIVKKVITFPAARKAGIGDPRLIYALEHRNHVGGLIQIARTAFKNDHIKIYYKPFLIPSWNLNLAAVIHVEKI